MPYPPTRTTRRVYIRIRECAAHYVTRNMEIYDAPIFRKAAHTHTHTHRSSVFQLCKMHRMDLNKRKSAPLLLFFYFCLSLFLALFARLRSDALIARLTADAGNSSERKRERDFSI